MRCGLRTETPGSPHVATPVARAWAIAAASTALKVPAGNAEADAWTVRGWADVAVGCVALAGLGAFGGLDEVIRSQGVASGGKHAARLRQLRQFAGPVPPWYPDDRPVAGPIRGVREIIWCAADLVAEFGQRLIATAATLPLELACPLVSARQLLKS